MNSRDFIAAMNSQSQSNLSALAQARKASLAQLAEHFRELADGIDKALGDPTASEPRMYRGRKWCNQIKNISTALITLNLVFLKKGCNQPHDEDKEA